MKLIILKKTLKILVVNLIITLVLLMVVEIISYLIIVCQYSKFKGFKEVIKEFRYKKIYNRTEENLVNFSFRPIEYRNPNKRPIILFGCSFTYGHGLNDEETFSRKLADYTDRTVVNRGLSGEGVSFLYFQVTSRNIMNKIKHSISFSPSSIQINADVEYIIYTFIYGHRLRNYRYKITPLDQFFNIEYQYINNKLERINVKHPFFHSLHTVTLINQSSENSKRKSDEYQELILIKEFQESFKILKNYFPNAKIVIFYMPDGQHDNANIKDDIEYFKTKFNDVIIINADTLIQDLRDKKYWISGDDHPSEYAWDVIVPKLSEELKINKEI